MLYIISMIVLVLLYACVLINMKHMKNTGLFNYIFSATVFVCYLCVVIRVYYSVGVDDWNFRNTLPVANVSPFMFTLVGFIHLVPSKIRKHLYLLISLLSVGMFLSAVLGCLYNALINYKFHLHFLSDYLAHILLSLWGVYLVKSRQVSLTKKNCIVSSSVIVGAALFMMLLNVIFDTSFFGLSLNGKHNIYNNVLTDNSLVSAALYFIGLTGVLFVGYLYSYFLSKEKTLSCRSCSCAGAEDNSSAEIALTVEASNNRRD